MRWYVNCYDEIDRDSEDYDPCEDQDNFDEWDDAIAEHE